jgi:hypothetical protein
MRGDDHLRPVTRLLFQESHEQVLKLGMQVSLGLLNKQNAEAVVLGPVRERREQDRHVK